MSVFSPHQAKPVARAVLAPPLHGPGRNASAFGTALVVFVVVLLAWTTMPGAGALLAGSRSAPLLLAVLATALALSRRGAASSEGEAGAAEARSYAALAASVGGIVARLRGDGRVLEARADDSDMGFAAKDLMGQGLFDKVHVADRPLFLQALSEAAHGEATKAVLVRLRRSAYSLAHEPMDGPSFVPAELRFRALESKTGGPYGAEVIVFARSISQMHALESSLEAARKEAELSKSLKDRLLANVSHELRTPLNAILGFSEILGDPELAPTDADKRLEYARIIHSSADHLLSVVNLVLDMSKIEAGKFDIVPEAFDIEPLIKDCCDMLRLKAAEGRVALTAEPLDEPLELIGDKRACRQILLNLLSNAVKFTLPDGAVSIGARRVGNEIHLHVRDTGIGIGSDHLKGLGNPFYQVRSSYNRGFEGAGLGLSLVRGLVGLHGGSMLLETECGVGTRVTARLPVDCRAISPRASNTTQLETLDTLPRWKPAAVAAKTLGEGERKFG